MIINQLIESAIDCSLPHSHTKLEIPCERFTLSMDMVEEDYFDWITSSESVVDYSVRLIADGIAHDVLLVIETHDGSASLLDVK